MRTGTEQIFPTCKKSDLRIETLTNASLTVLGRETNLHCLHTLRSIFPDFSDIVFVYKLFRSIQMHQ